MQGTEYRAMLGIAYNPGRFSIQVRTNNILPDMQIYKNLIQIASFILIKFYSKMYHYNTLSDR
jgi:hypothetical protein